MATTEAVRTRQSDIPTIFAAARRVFARVGVEGATMEAIAAEAGLPVDEVTRRYPHKTALQNALLAAWAADGMDGADGDGDALPTPPVTVTIAAPPAAPPAHALSPEPTEYAEPVRGGVAENRTVAADMAQLAVLSLPPRARAGGGAPLGEIYRAAVASLGANRMRTLLTMLGIIIGVTAVVALLAVGNAFTGYMTGELTANGASSVYISGAPERGIDGISTGKRRSSLTLADAYALRDAGTLPIDAVSPVMNGQGQATAGIGNLSVAIIGAWEDYPKMQGIRLSRGAFFTQADELAAAPVVAIGANVAKTLFGEEDPVGRNMRLNGATLEVVGVMEAVGALGTTDDAAIVPLSSAYDRVIGQRTSTRDGSQLVDQILLRAPTIDDITPAADAATEILAVRHQTDTGETPDFEVITVASQLKTIQNVLNTLGIFLAVIASISLLVGGIGIMNIMLVSVTERTREIGIRKAIGAKEGDILSQFVMEAGLIGLIGGGAGVAFGMLIAGLVTVLWRPAEVGVLTVAVALGVSVATGLVFGVAPARRAARLKPIEALRAE